MSYTQLTQEQRYQIYALLKTAHSQTEIATVIGVHKSTISRELLRNCGKRGYRPQQAHRFAKQRRRKSVEKMNFRMKKPKTNLIFYAPNVGDSSFYQGLNTKLETLIF